jgi:hypothetical protein
MATMAVMADGGPFGDETVARDTGETLAREALPHRKSADSMEFAWSQGNDSVDDRHDEQDAARQPATVSQSWGATLGRAGALLGVGLLVAGAIVLAHLVLSKPKSANQAHSQGSNQGNAPASASTAPATSVLTRAPVSITSTPDQDNRYIASLNDKGITFANPDAAVHNGKTFCQNIAQGSTVQQVVVQFQQQSPEFSDRANDIVTLSVHAYCPQYDSLVPAS